MHGDKKQLSWMDAFENYPHPPGISEEQAHKNTFVVDNALLEFWNLGRNQIQLWAEDGFDMLLLVVPHYRLEEFATEEHLIEEVLMGSKLTTAERLEQAANIFKVDVKRIKLPFKPGEGLSRELISALVQRFGISLVKDRAVALFDIAGFSLLSPLEQVTQLNSLSYSVNSAHNKLMERSINIHFSRSTTGDGFYIWNRERDSMANIALFDLLQLILADNLIARRKAKGKTVPALKTCFHVGSHYEYHQAIGLNPSTFSYIVGNVSIELARMIEKCQPGQILIGDFKTPMTVSDQGEKEMMDTVSFINRVQKEEVQLRNVILSEEKIDSVNCYLTGSADDEHQTIKKYRITDKHNLSRSVYNVKVDISLANSDMLPLGLPPSKLSAF
ncbi:MAG: hypothetical protein K9M17_05870 [Mariprofundaceae bacterium]|nr:hypothetical protein [Mariprofundaceae bacterium]